MNIDYSKATSYAKQSAPQDIEDDDEDDEDSCWQRRSSLEQILIMTVIIIFSFAVGCVVFIVLKYIFITEFCNTAVCLKEAVHVASYVNTDVNPCDDFFLFVCSKPEENINEIGIQQVSDKMQDHINELIKQPITNDDPHWIKNQKVLYQSCMDKRGSEESLEIFNELLEEFNGWPVVVGYLWKARLFEWTEAIAILKRDGYPFSMMLRFSAVMDDDVGRYIIELSNPILDEVPKEHRNAYKKFMTDAAVIFGADRYQAGLQMPEVLDFMDALENITKIIREQGDNTKVKTTIDEMQRIYTEIDWLETINNIVYPAINVSVNDYVIFPTFEYLDTFFELLGKTTKRIQANYIIWTVLEEMMPFMSEELQYLKGNYSCQTQNYVIQERNEFCINLVDKISFDLEYVKSNLEVAVKQQIELLYNAIKSEFLNALRESSWIVEEISENYIDFVESIDEIIGAPDFFNDTLLKGLEYMEENVTEFFRIILMQNKIKTFKLHSIINTTHNPVNLLETVLEVEPTYLKQYNVLVLPLPLFQSMPYMDDKPIYLNFARIGAKIGRELANSLYQNILSENATNSLEQQLLCMENKENNETVDSKIVEEIIAPIIGIKTAYKAYLAWALENTAELQIAGTDYTPNQLFWISSISTYCSKLDEGHLRNSSNTFTATTAFRNNPDFINDFKCPIKTEMNPTRVCEIL